MGLEEPSDQVRSRMRNQLRSDTAPELELRRELFRRGLRYRVGLKVPGRPRRTIDIAFPGKRLALFVDGCFWHRCPDHAVPVKNNGSWWVEKLESNVARDLDTTAVLEQQGWVVLRIWEHEAADLAADRVSTALESARLTLASRAATVDDN